jgi:Tol biopolymer transport system component
MLAYTRVDGGTARLFVHDVTTDERTRVLTGEDVPGEPRFLDEAAFGPTGDRLVFCAVFNRRSELYVVDVDGSDLVLISGDRSLCDPDWSSTDRIVAAVEERRLFTLDPDGSDVELLVKLERPKDPGKGATLDPSWSPDGSTVAFPSSAGQLRSDIWLIDGDGTDLRRFTDSRNRWEFGGQWAPDGSAIAFAQGGRRFLSLTDLWVKPLSGGRDRLTDTPRFDEFIESWRPVD